MVKEWHSIRARPEFSAEGEKAFFRSYQPFLRRIAGATRLKNGEKYAIFNSTGKSCTYYKAPNLTPIFI
jgi:hypothetical protein